MNKQLVVVAGAALLAGFLTAGRAAAQFAYGAGYNPYTGRAAQGGAAYNPYTGGYARGGSAYNPYTGRSTTARATYNPWTGRAAVGVVNRPGRR
jgi:hypothetical protein